MEKSRETTGSGPTDVAALSAGVTAIAVSMFLTPGPYDPTGALVSLTLLAVIYAYIGRHDRTHSQSAAVASLVGIICMPLTGFAVELYLAPYPLALINHTDPLNCKTMGCRPESAVANGDILAGWLIFAILTFTYDRFRKRGSRTRP